MSAVSILIPTYEPNPEHLRAALESIVVQTFRDWSVLIHDDASRADVRAIIEPFLTDSRFHFSRNPQRLGIGGNWNACLKEAKGEYVQFLFQDDLWEPQYLERSVDVLNRESTVGFVAANHVYSMEGSGNEKLYDEVTAARHELTPGRQDRIAFLRSWMERGLRPNIIGEPSFVMLRRSLMEKVGFFNTSMRQGLDFEYWMRCLLQADWHYLSEHLGTFRVHAGGASERNRASGDGMFDRLRCFKLLLRTLPPSDLRRSAWRGMIRYILHAIRG
ncbi:glycosyltransferase [Candidatus Peregrinibacteria bacterium]|nr:glycosyltransferase [Candidatus Peregrinibacteria bacterium]MBI3816780.1 glycosyltransferase [Candidatus Peregrinibacteria bacterium]